MTITNLIAKHCKEAYFGGNWSTVYFEAALADVDWQTATIKVDGYNTIATLAHHITYYTVPITKVLQGMPLVASDAASFATPSITNDVVWKQFLQDALSQASVLVTAIEDLNDDILFNDFAHEKYGNYYRNLHGYIEHTHYHLGQIVILKKMIANQNL